jgi:kynurenine formamidase
VTQLFELTLPLDREWMPDELFPTATHFLFAPRGHPEKGTTVGTDSGTALLLPSQFREFRKQRRVHDLDASELVLRPTAVIDLPRDPGQAIEANDVDDAISRAEIRRGDAWLVRTGWGSVEHERGTDRYMLDSPFLTPAAARRLGEAMRAVSTDLLLVDTALISRPDKHLIPEWTVMNPRPLCHPSEAARAYLQGYRTREVLADWEADFELASAGIMTVRRLVNCDAIPGRRTRLIIAPLRVVRGVGAPCRVVACHDGDRA